MLFNHNRAFEDREAIRSIGLIHPSGLGDALLALPALHLIKKKLGLHITIGVRPDAVPWLSKSPFIDEVVPVDAPFLAKPLREDGYTQYRNVISQLRQIRSDIVYEVRGDIRMAILLRLARRHQAIGGLTCGGGGFLLDRTLPPFQFDGHTTQLYNAVAQDSGLMDDPMREWSSDLVPFTAPDPALLPSRPYLAVHVGTGWPSKQWPVDRFLNLTKKLATRWPVVVLGAKSDLDTSQMTYLATIENCWNLVGKCDFSDCIGVIAGAAAYIGQDTGATHAATLLEKPCVALYSGVVDNQFHPLAKSEHRVRVLQHRPQCSGKYGCARRSCDNHLCMEAISIDDVQAALAAVWS